MVGGRAGGMDDFVSLAPRILIRESPIELFRRLRSERRTDALRDAAAAAANRLT